MIGSVALVVLAWETIGGREVGSMAPLVLAWEAIGKRGWEHGSAGVGLSGHQRECDWERGSAERSSTKLSLGGRCKWERGSNGGDM